MTYPQVIQYLETFVNYEKLPAWAYKESCRLDRTIDFLFLVGNPQNALKCLHISGTKGKGSTCVFLAYILRQAGYKVGLYTSPHLSDFRERIRILSQQVTKSASHQGNEEFEGMITKKELTKLVQALKPAIEKYNRNSTCGPLSFFEVYTALAFIYFKEKKVNFAVLETGLGGRLDATNVVNPLVCAITPISYEHTQKLGNTLQEIAVEKAGIIKSCRSLAINHQPVVITAPQENEAMRVIRKKCQEAKAKLYEVGRDIVYQKIGGEFRVKGIFRTYPDLKIKLIGTHQLLNAAVAVGIIEALRSYNIKVGIELIRAGLYNTRWPGRCEVIAKNPLVVLDGAQNIASARALKKAIKGNFKYARLILILGISSDKDIKGICNELNKLADEVILTRADNPRASKPQELAKYFINNNVCIANSVKDAKAEAWRRVKKKDLILITGSLYVVGEARVLF